MAHVEKTGRNNLCPCGSGKKYKKCCETKQRRQAGGRALMFVVLAVIAGAIVAAVVSFGERSYSSAAPGRVWSPEHGHYH